MGSYTLWDIVTGENDHSCDNEHDPDSSYGIHFVVAIMIGNKFLRIDYPEWPLVAAFLMPLTETHSFARSVAERQWALCRHLVLLLERRSTCVLSVCTTTSFSTLLGLHS